ncbi:MAG TPA: putative zinc-binding peptidase [Planctomycetota bacterium]|nr:putative zinc-binding peptidase [Planctomycetota bacterium]
MKLFACQSCGAQLYFENVRCLACGHELGFIPEENILAAIEPNDDGTWHSTAADFAGITWRKCARYANDGVCNWLVRSGDANELCRSCRMTRTIPDLSRPGNHDAWRRMEIAKRRLIYGLTSQGLPVVDRSQDPDGGLVFEFLADTPQHKAITGHSDGLITVNIAEADPVERERARTNLHEGYRTILGHLRHESGHYFWDRLVRQGPRLEEVRALFGDDRQDYAAAMKRHYEQGSHADWSNGFVSAYATMHPWEDWAETWAHYLHMVDAVEIAGHLGLSLKTRPQGSCEPLVEMTAPREAVDSFEGLLAAWIPLTFATNCLTRSIGHQDWYPFVLSDGVIAKLRLVHAVIADARSGSVSEPVLRMSKAG